MATRKLSEPTTKTTVRLFTSDIERAKSLFPKLSVSRVYRIVFRQHLDRVEQNLEARRALIEEAAMEAPDAE